MAVETGPKFYPRVQPGPDPVQTRKINSLGKKTATKRTGKLSSLEVWEGYRVFRDERSPTGWIDLHRIPIVAVDTNGHALRLNLKTGKPEYVDATPAGSGGGLFGTIAKVLAYSGADLGGLALQLSGQEDLNKIRVQTGVGVTAAIVSAGGLGATSLAGLGGASSTLGGAAALLGGAGGGFASMLGSPLSGESISPAESSRQGAPPEPRSGISGTTVVVILAIAAVGLLLLRKSR